MDLKKDIKRKQAKQRRKQPFKRGVFNQISCIVRTYGLKENFLNILENVEKNPSKMNLNAGRVRMKKPIESPLFSLVTEDEYAITKSIENKVDNAYLMFAHSPEELLWCGPLYRLNSSLTTEKLERYHFETLFLHELAKKENMRV